MCLKKFFELFEPRNSLELFDKMKVKLHEETKRLESSNIELIGMRLIKFTNSSSILINPNFNYFEPTETRSRFLLKRVLSFS